MISNILDEGILDKEKYKNSPVISKQYVEEAIDFVLKRLDKLVTILGGKFPSPASINLTYKPIENNYWTSSFFTGMLWLAYEITAEKKYKQLAQAHVESFAERLNKKIEIDTHDLGFLYTLSCVAGYKLTQNEKYKKIAIEAASCLSERFNKNAQIIQAWGDLDNANQRGQFIIDGLMNLPLLYWTTNITGDKKYFNIAYSHAIQTANYIIRKDASTFHTFFIDTETGEPLYGKTAQGYSDYSCWARGQAWGVYGFLLSYLYTGQWEFVELSKKLANFFLNRLPQDYIPYWDLIFKDGDGEEKDSSSAAILLCGLLEFLKILPLVDEYRMFYENASKNILFSLTQSYLAKNIENSNGILLHGVYSKPHNKGINEHCIWGDYFYFEALVRFIKDWKIYW